MTNSQTGCGKSKNRMLLEISVACLVALAAVQNLPPVTATGIKRDSGTIFDNTFLERSRALLTTDDANAQPVRTDGQDAVDTQLSSAQRAQTTEALAQTNTTIAASPVGCTDFPTREHDDHRTGRVSCETKLNVGNVHVSTFGKIGSMHVDGTTYAAPLFISSYPIPNHNTLDVALVATMHNKVYLFDVSNPQVPLWTIDLGPYIPKGSFPNTGGDVNADIGVLSTPTIDRASNTVWVVAANMTNGKIAYYLHARNLATGSALVNPILISESTHCSTSVPPGCKAPDAVNGFITFVASDHLQRPGLLFKNGLVHVAFGGHGDVPPYHGWIISYDARTLVHTGGLVTSARSSGAAVWQAGVGLATDIAGSIYFATGNGIGSNAALDDDRAESVIRMTASTTSNIIADWFTPENWQYLDNKDLDVGVSGPMLIPGSGHLILGSKTGTLYNVPLQNMGHITPQDAQLTDKIQASSGEIRGAAALWDGPQGARVFISPINDRLQAFGFDGTHLTHTALYKVGGTVGEGFITVSSNGVQANTGVVWTSTADYGGSLHAYDASNLHVLYNSENNAARDHSGGFVKFLPPTVANGRVLLGTTLGRVDIYGLL